MNYKQQNYFLPLRFFSGAFSKRRKQYIRNTCEYLPPLRYDWGKTEKNKKYSANISFYFPYQSEGRADLDNLLKPLFDLLKKRCFWDDVQVTHLQAEIIENSGKMGVEVKLHQL